MFATFWKNNKWILCGILLLCAAIVLSLFGPNGSYAFTDFVKAVFSRRDADQVASLILWGVRLPRMLAGIFCGIGLSVAGYLMQESLNNRLAAPSIMGINNGAGLFALIGICLFQGGFVVRGLFSFSLEYYFFLNCLLSL